MEEIKVLICHKDSRARDNLRRAIQFDPILNVAGSAKSGKESLEIAQELFPDVVLMSLSLGDMDGIEAAQRLQENAPFVQIILLAHELDYNVMRRAMNFGISDVIKWPVDPDDLHAKIHEAAARKRKIMSRITGPLDEQTPAPEKTAGPKGKILAVYSPKGGVGCTLLATNLALLLHRADIPAVLVDGDLQFGDVSIFLNQAAGNTVSDLVPHVDEMDDEMIEEVLLQHENGLKVLAAPPSPEMADDMTSEIFGKILDHLQRKFAYVVIDTGSALDDVTVTILEKADLILTIATPDIPSIKNSRAFFGILAALEISMNRVILVLNGVQRGDMITNDDITKTLKIEVAAELPFDRKAVLESINKGKPLLLEGRGNPLARGMIELLGVIKERMVEEVVMELEAVEN